MAGAAKNTDEAPAKRVCFVIGPIGGAGSDVRKAADWLLKGAIKPVLEDLGFEVKRADEDADPGEITGAVLRDVLTADLAIADLAGHNPNAFYELGVRHAAGLPAVHVKMDTLPIPFDNKDQRTLDFDHSGFDAWEAAKEVLRRMVEAAMTEGHQVSNPVTRAKGTMELRASADPRDQQLAALQDRIEHQEARIRDIIDRARQTEQAATGPAAMRSITAALASVNAAAAQSASTMPTAHSIVRQPVYGGPQATTHDFATATKALSAAIDTIKGTPKR